MKISTNNNKQIETTERLCYYIWEEKLIVYQKGLGVKMINNSINEKWISMVLACLLHDASECYMSDVPTPFKNELPEYQEQEEHLLGIIYEKFLGSDLTEEEQKELKKIDHAMLWYDLEHLLGEIQYGEIPELHIDLDYTVRPFEEVEEEYLSLFEKIQ